MQTKKETGTSFQAAVFVDFFDEIIFMEYDINWPHFITRMCLIPKLLSKMYFLFYAWAFDDVMKCENLKF